MKAMRFHENGEPTVLHLDDVETPAPAAGEVRIAVEASAFNPADNGIRAGFLPIPVTLPHTPGYDVAGMIDALGDDVSGLAIGDRVIGFLPMDAPGAAAEFVIAPANVLVAAPSGIPLADAAAIPSVALTAWQALFDEAALKAGQRVLVVGAGGTVGGYAVRLAKHAGAFVIATASERSSESVRAAGADVVIDHTRLSVLDAVTEPVDVLLNLAPIDPEEFTALVGRVRDGGVVVSTTAWMPAPSDEGRGVRSAVIYVRSDTEQLARIVSLVDEGVLKVEIAQRVPLADLVRIHEEATAGTLRGKVIVLPGA